MNGVTNDKVSVAFFSLIFTWPDNIHCDTLVIHNIRLLEKPFPSHDDTLDFSNSSKIWCYCTFVPPFFIDDSS